MHQVKDSEKDNSLLEPNMFLKQNSNQKFDTNLNDESTVNSLLNGSLHYSKVNNKQFIGTSKISPNVSLNDYQVFQAN